MAQAMEGRKGCPPVAHGGAPTAAAVEGRRAKFECTTAMVHETVRTAAMVRYLQLRARPHGCHDLAT